MFLVYALTSLHGVREHLMEICSRYKEIIKVSSITTLYVEIFFSELREGNDMHLMLQFCYRFLAFLRESLKYSTSCPFNYFTSVRHYYSKPDSNLIQVQLPKLQKPPRNTIITKSQLDEMRVWRAEHGQSVRQLT